MNDLSKVNQIRDGHHITSRDKCSRSKQLLMLFYVCVCVFASQCFYSANPLLKASFEKSANYQILSHLGLNYSHTPPPPGTLATVQKQGAMETASLLEAEVDAGRQCSGAEDFGICSHVFSCMYVLVCFTCFLSVVGYRRFLSQDVSHICDL